MDGILNWLWQGSAVAAAAYAACRLLDRGPARARFLLCGAALTAVVALPLAWLIPARTGSPAQTVEAIAAAPALTIPDAWWTSATVVTVLWMVWCGVSVVRIASALVALRRTTQSLRPFPADVESRLRAWNAVRNDGRRTRLAISSQVNAAAVLGCGSPVIAIAPSLLEHLAPADLDRVVIHEWAHVQRRDDLVNAVQALVRAAAGWHPAVWWIDRRLSLEREVACDEMVVAMTGNPKTYASCLAALATLAPRSAQPAASLGVLSRPALSRRIVRILANRRQASAARSTVAAVGASLTVIALAIAVGTLQPIAIAASAPGVTRPAGAPLGIDAKTTAAVPNEVSRLGTPQQRQSDGRGRANDGRVRQSERTAVSTKLSVPAVALEPQPAVPASALETPDAVPMLSTSAAAARLLDITPPRPVESQPEPTLVPGDRQQSPWGAAADAGIAVGRGSQTAGVATASFVSRLGKRIAGSF